MGNSKNHLTETLCRRYSMKSPVNNLGQKIFRKQYHDGGGLYLEVRECANGTIRAHWVFRKQKTDTTKGFKLSLGSYPQVNLAKAREAVLKVYVRLQSGEEVVPASSHGSTKTVKEETLAKVSDKWFQHAIAIGHYKKTLYAYRERQRFTKNVLKRIGAIPIKTLTFEDVASTFREFWNQNATRDRALGTLRNVLTYAINKNLAPSSVLDTVTFRRLVMELGSSAHEDKNQPSLPVERIPAFMAALRNHVGVKFRLLEFQILCALRSGNAIQLRWDQLRELDSDNPYVSFSKKELKVGKNGDLCIPLSPRCVEILHEMEDYRQTSMPADQQFVFPSVYRAGTCLSDATPCNVIRVLHEEEIEAGRCGWIDPVATEASEDGKPVRVTAHGVARASFRTFAAARPFYREHAIELCLHHREKNKTKEAYDRFDYFDERRTILNDWSVFCESEM